jgi:xylulokinase
MKPFIISHDLGTTGNKATLYDPEGKLVAFAFAAYGVDYDHPGWAEQNPNDWWQAVCDSTRQLLLEARVSKSDIAAVSFSGQMMGCVLLDQRARPVRQAIIWADQRATAQAERVGQGISKDAVYRITGHRLSAAYSLAKALWLKDHDPAFAQAHKIVQAKDALIARLTGRFVSDHSDASGTNLYDLHQRGWSEAILQASELDVSLWPEILESSEVAGGVLPSIAEEVGLQAGTPVVVGGGDGMCAAAGAGVVRQGRAYNYVGSSSWIALATSQPVLDPTQRTFCWAHMVPGMYSPCGTMQMAGGSYQWARDQLASIEVKAAGEQNISAYELMNATAAGSPVGAKGLVFLPYLLGERSPRWNPHARGALVGLTVRHRRADIIRAVLEGITFNLGVILQAFSAQGVSADSMRVIGGGAKGRFWNQMMADIYGLPVHRLAILEEATSMGAALAGGIGVGLYKDWSMSEQMNAVVEVLEPDPQAEAKYAKLGPIWDAAYSALEPIFDQLAGFEQ